MAIVRPFPCIRPRQDVAAQVAALPYDVYSRAEATDEVKGKPLSFLNIDRAETQLGPEIDTYDARVYEKAGELFRARVWDATFVTEMTPCFFVYALTMDGRTQTGLVGCSSIWEYEQGIVKRHENTREDKEQDRIRHIEALGAQTGPILLAYRANPGIGALIEKATQGKPLYDFVSEDGIGHRVWRVGDAYVARGIMEAFARVGATYIADGHHRAASAYKVGKRMAAENPNHTGEEEYNFFLSVLFPDDQLRILPYNRVVRGLAGLTKGQFLERLGAQCKVSPWVVPEAPGVPGAQDSPFMPDRRHTFGMYLDGAWYRLEIHGAPESDGPVTGTAAGMADREAGGGAVTGQPAGMADREAGSGAVTGTAAGMADREAGSGADPCIGSSAVEGLDVSLLQDRILGPILGIGDPRTDGRISFVGGIRGPGELKRRVDEMGEEVAFSMYPTSIGELFAVADAGLLMPPKSTWFEPKLRSGLFIHEI